MKRFGVEERMILDKQALEDDPSRKGKIYAMLRMKDLEIEAEREYCRTHVCPCCHLVMPTNGKCDCGYTARRIG